MIKKIAYGVCCASALICAGVAWAFVMGLVIVINLAPIAIVVFLLYMAFGR